jgi:hypothetical protein
MITPALLVAMLLLSALAVFSSFSRASRLP